MVNEWVVCPICFWATKLHQKKGTKEFGKFDLNSNFFIQIRTIKGGKGTGGFWTDKDKSLTLSQALQIPEYLPLISQIDAFVLRWIKFRKLKK